MLFCALSLTIGFFVPRLLRVERRQAVASAFEIGIHNATLAIVIAVSVLGSEQMQLPAAVYGVLMFFVALAFGLLIARRCSTLRTGASRLVGPESVSDGLQP